MKRTFNLLVLITLLALAFGAQGVTPAAAAFPLPTVPPGYQISVLTSDGILTSDGRTLDGIVADPLSGNVYVATVTAPIGFSGFYAADFKLYQITPGGVVTLIGTYPYAHYEVVKMAWGPDGMIYTGNINDYRIYKIDPATGATSLFGQGPFIFRHGINFDPSGDLIVSNEPDFVFYRVTPAGPTFLGNTSPAPPNGNHGDAFGIQPDGNYVVYSDNCGVPMNNYALDTAGHIDGANYSVAWVGATDLQSIYAPGSCVVGYSNGAIDPLSGDVYSITANFGRGISSIAFTPAAGGASTAFVTGAGNSLNDGSQQGIVDLTFGKATNGVAGCNSLFFVDRYQSTVYEVTPECDTTPPVITVPSDITAEATSSSGAVVNFSVSATDETSPANPAVTCDWPSGSTFPLGTTAVTCEATDDAGNTGYGYFNVTVEDTTAPTLYLPGNFSVPQTMPTGAVVTFSASATDAVDPLSPSVSCVPAFGDTFPVGTTTVNCEATDTAGNTAYGSFDVTVTKGLNLLKKPTFDNATAFPTPWKAFGFRPPYIRALDCTVFNFGPCSVLFPAGNRAAYQQVNLVGHAGDTYSFGMYSAANNGGGTYRVELLFYNNFNKLLGSNYLDFNAGTHDFELVNGSATAPVNYNKIIFRFVYQNPTGRAWFDDAFLYFLGNIE